MKALRAILGTRTSWGSLTMVWCCGLIFGMHDLLEAEGLEEVDEGIRHLMPDKSRLPTVLFYDKVSARVAFPVGLPCSRGDYVP